MSERATFPHAIHISGRALGVFLVVIGLALPALGAEPIEFEGEDYTGSFDLGGYPIARAFCAGASNMHVAHGIDLPGEWIEIPVNILEAGCYDSWVRVQGFPDVTSTLRMTFIDAGPSGEDLTAEYTYAGQGAG
jgi:hypothetical protein